MSLWRRLVRWLARRDLLELQLQISVRDLEISMFKVSQAFQKLGEAAEKYRNTILIAEENKEQKVIH